MAAVLAVIGCGGIPGAGGMTHPPDPLLGTWALSSGSCIVAKTFTADGQYENDFICQTATGGIGLDAEVGAYSATASRITFAAAQATCPGVTKIYYVDYSIQGGRLSLVFLDGVEALAPYTPSGAGAATFGCWSMGTFTPGPLAPVP